MVMIVYTETSNGKIAIKGHETNSDALLISGGKDKGGLPLCNLDL